MAANALARLRKLAEGNGLAPDVLHLFSAEEKIYDIEGTITLLPLFETAGGRHPGGPGSPNARVVGNSAALKAEIDKLKQNFETGSGWINEAIAQLKEQPGEGWGLDDVRISLPSQSAVLAASEACPTCQGSRSITCQQCRGQGFALCPQCQGRRQEICPICLGSGQNPSQPGQTCINCHGIRYTTCRACHGSGNVTCPVCQGSRGTVCSACSGTGVFTEEIAIACGARTQFSINAQGLPSGLRRGLDRLGMANLAKGHADIETLAPPSDPEDSVTQPPPMPGAKPEPKKEKPPKPEIHYVAHVPYADLRMNFAGKKAMVGVFGKHNVVIGVPFFLDTSLEPARTMLKRAAKGEAKLDEALKLRAIKDALNLQLAGKGGVKELRRIYPLGLSPAVAEEILRNTRLALNTMTLMARSLAAVLCSLGGSGIFAGIFLTGFHKQATQNLSLGAGLGLDAGVLAAVIAACWFALSFATRFALRRHFPDLAIPVTQKTGKTGMMMIAALALVFGIVLFLTPDKPMWLSYALAALGLRSAGGF